MHILLCYAHPHTSMQVFEMIYWHKKLSKINFFNFHPGFLLLTKAGKKAAHTVHKLGQCHNGDNDYYIINQPAFHSSDSKCACSFSAC